MDPELNVAQHAWPLPGCGQSASLPMIRNVPMPDFPDVLSISKAGLVFKDLSKHQQINRLALTMKKARREHRALISL